ncbi:MAG: hypothetical protein AAFN77_06635 [Planctomycetota bacterium]
MNTTTASQGYSASAPEQSHRAPEYGYRMPVRPIKSAAHSCPHCQSSAHGRPNTFARMRLALTQLFVAIVVIILSILRLARLIVAGAFTLVGLIGTGMYIAGQYIIHPDDKRLLPNLPSTRQED